MLWHGPSGNSLGRHLDAAALINKLAQTVSMNIAAQRFYFLHLIVVAGSPAQWISHTWSLYGTRADAHPANQPKMHASKQSTFVISPKHGRLLVQKPRRPDTRERE